MCLAIPMEIIEINGMNAVAEANGVRTDVNITLTPDVQLNQKVLVHAGFVIEKLDEQTAKEIQETWDEYMTMLESEDAKE